MFFYAILLLFYFAECYKEILTKEDGVIYISKIVENAEVTDDLCQKGLYAVWTLYEQI